MSQIYMCILHMCRYGTRWQMWLTCTHMNESCHTWMSHVTSSHVTHEWVMSQICHTYLSHVTHDRVMSHLQVWNEVPDVPHLHTHEWVMSHMNEYHTWLSHVTHIGMERGGRRVSLTVSRAWRRVVRRKCVGAHSPCTYPGMYIHTYIQIYICVCVCVYIYIYMRMEACGTT